MCATAFFHGAFLAPKRGRSRDRTEQSNNIAMKSSVDRKIRYRFFFSLSLSLPFQYLQSYLLLFMKVVVVVCVFASDKSIQLKKKDFFYLSFAPPLLIS